MSKIGDDLSHLQPQHAALISGTYHPTHIGMGIGGSVGTSSWPTVHPQYQVPSPWEQYAVRQPSPDQVAAIQKAADFQRYTEKLLNQSGMILGLMLQSSEVQKQNKDDLVKIATETAKGLLALMGINEPPR